MAERVVSPGVFTREIDQSFLAPGVASIGAAVVGPTVKGPAFVPTTVTSFAEFQSIFGGYSEDLYVPYVVDEYFQNGNTMTVTRLLYEDGYQLNNGALAIVAESASIKVVTHVLHPVQACSGSSLFANSILTTGSNGSFELKISGSYSTISIPGFTGFTYQSGQPISASINSAAAGTFPYLGNILGTSPTDTAYPVYIQYEYKNAYNLFNNPTQITASLRIINDYEFLQDYNHASTPWITSQLFGATTKNLFKFHTLSHGTSTSHELKVIISNIRHSSEVVDQYQYATFDVTLRRVKNTEIPNSPYGTINDDDVLNPNIVASNTFTNVNLNPDSADFIGRRIGTRYISVDDSYNVLINGDYDNRSSYIRVELAPEVTSKAISNTAMPFGFRSLYSPIPMLSGSVNIASASYKTNQNQAGAGYNSSVVFGFDFSIQNNLNYLAPIPTSGSNTGSNADFYLGDMFQPAQANYPVSAPYSASLQAALTSSATSFATNIAVSTRKFAVPFQGGFDGTRPNLPKFSGQNISATNTFGFDCSGGSTTGTIAYRKAFSVLRNQDLYDFNLLLTPGVIHYYHPTVTNEARNLVTNRSDAFYVMDPVGKSATVSDVVSAVQTIDNNYTAAYYPWVNINKANGGTFFVPPSVVVAGALALNDAVQAPWFAPAGLNRGALTQVNTLAIQTDQAARDTLYQARVNPITRFAVGGHCIWGQKTLQALPSALDRVNVRRLLIEVKKFIASSTKYLVFEQNSDATRGKFLSIVNPYLDAIRLRQGLSAFRVVMDSSNNTNDLIDQNILYGQIFLQPTRTAEFIIIDFNIQPTGAAFAV